MDTRTFDTISDILSIWTKLVYEKPDAAVIVDGADASKVFTRRNVDELSARVRAWLKQQSVGREDMVMIDLPRGAAGMIAMLGVWKAGAAFIMVETNYPPERIEFIKKDAGVKTVIDIDVWQEIMEMDPLYGFDTADIHDAAFAVYTSGSTGRPKGVLHEYGTLKMNLMCGIAKNQFEVSDSYHIAHIAPFSFVASIKIALVSFSTGLVMYILPYETIKNPIRLKMYFLENKINCAFLTPSLLRSAGTDFGPYLKVVITGSEPAGGIDPGDIILINTYTMSESAFTVTEFMLDKKYDICPVGTPNIPGLGLKLLDEMGNETAPGEEGEICFNNPFFREYIGLPEETAEVKRGGLYHTGDLGRFDENGQLVLTGRINDMVKINGNRVEPSEIEVVAKRVLPIDQCIVKGFIDAKRSFLCLFYTADMPIDVAAAREKLSEDLPYYMMPAYFIKLDEIPVLPNGKINKRALKAPDPTSAGAYVPPRNDVEKKICQAMEKVLDLKKISIYDDFYDIGGDSLASMSVLAETGIEDLNAMDVFKGRTPEKIAAIYEENRRKQSGISAEEYEAEARKRPLKMTAVQMDMFDRQLYNPKKTMFNLPQIFVTDDLSSAEKFETVLNQVARNHPAFSMIIEFGEEDLPVLRYVPERCPVIRLEEMSEEQFQALRPNLVGLHPLVGHTLFEVRLIRTEAHVYLFFNPHHIVIDGMGYQALFANIARAYRGEPLVPDTFCTFLARNEELQESERHYEDKAFLENLYGGKEWARDLIPDLKSNENLMETVPFPIQISVKDAEQFEKISKLSRNGLFTIAAMMALSKCLEKDDIMIAWGFHNRTDASEMRAVGQLATVLPLGISFSEYETLQDLYTEMKQQSAAVLEHCTYEYTYSLDNVFESDSMCVVYETAAIADQGTLSEIGLVSGQGSAEVISTNNVALLNMVVFVYEFPETIQPLLVYSKSVYSDKVINEYLEAFTECLKNIVAATDPVNTKIADLMRSEEKSEESEKINPDTKVKDLAREYPWVEKKLPDVFPEAKKYLSNPLTRRVLMGMTLGVVASQLGIPFEEMREKIRVLLASNP